MLGYLVARRLTAPPRARTYPLRVRATTPTTVTVDATPTTTLPGEWGLFLASGGHARVTGTPAVAAGLATWTLAAGSSAPAPGVRVSWSGIVDPAPPPGTTQWRMPAGPAWVIRPDGAGSVAGTWAVHVHGLGSTRAGTLRGVRAATAAGLPSLVPAYRNTLDGERRGRGRSHLGATEGADLREALARLRGEGAERFVLFGWSMGAQLCLAAAIDPEWAPRIHRIVLDSPVLDWRAVLAANVARAHLPRAAARGAEAWLGHPRRARRLGLDAPIDLDALDGVRRASEIAQPVLVHHGLRDWSVPIAASRAFVAHAPDARLVTGDGGHTTGWNTDPVAWQAETVAFLDR